MYRIFAYMFRKFELNVSKYSIHEASGYYTDTVPANKTFINTMVVVLGTLL